MTTNALFYEGITFIVSDLSKDFPAKQRYERLLIAMRKIFPFDAAAVLRLEGDILRPLATYGLSHDTIGRRFLVKDPPRLNT
ncbi:Probable transcriptional regulator, partial [Moritella viscosa]